MYENYENFRMDMLIYFYIVLGWILNFVCILIIGFYFYLFENLGCFFVSIEKNDLIFMVFNNVW